MTSEQYELLAETFVEVKAEFGDLDGMSWERPDAQAMLRQWKLQQVPLTSKYRRTVKAASLMTRSSASEGIERPQVLVPMARSRASIPSAFTTLDDERALHPSSPASRIALHPVLARFSSSSSDDANATVTGTRFNAGTWNGTLGRSYRNGTRERPPLPSYTMGRTSSAMGSRVDRPRVLEPIRRVLTEEGTQEGEEPDTHGSVMSGGSLRAGHAPANRCSPRSPRSPRSPSSPRFRHWGSKPRHPTLYFTAATPRYVTMPPASVNSPNGKMGLGLVVPS